MNPPDGPGCRLDLDSPRSHFFPRRTRSKLSGLRRLAIDPAGAVCVLLFLFVFMQWASLVQVISRELTAVCGRLCIS